MTKDEALRQFAEQGRITNTGDEREKALEAFAKEGRIAPKQPDLWALQPESTGVPSVPAPATPAKTLSPSKPPLFKPGEERPVGWDAMTGNIPDNPDLKTEQDMWHSFIAGGKGGIGNVVSGLGYLGTKLRGQKLKDWAYNTADEWARSAAESQMKVQNPESLLNRVVSGTGSSLPMMVPSLLASLAAAPAGGALGAGLVGMGVRGLMGSSEAAGNAGEVYRDMIAQGLSPELAEQGADRSFMTELPLNILTEHLGVFGNMGSKVIKSPIARSIAGEALQEGAQETYQALIPEAAKGSAGKGLMDYAGNLAKQVPNAPGAFMNEGVPAMISGALMGGGGQLVANIQARQTPGTVAPAPSPTPVGLPPAGGVTQGADRNALAPQSYQFNGGEVRKPVPVAPVGMMDMVKPATPQETPKPVVAKTPAATPGMVTPQEQKPLTTNPKTLSEIMEQTSRAYANAASQLSNVIGGPKAPSVQPTVQPPIQPKREPKGNLGKEEEIVTPDGRTKIGTQFAIVPADSLVASNTADMEANPDYPQELQPRNRERTASLAQINDIVNNLDPERLGESRLSSEGAPIVGAEDGVVESGNGRTIAIQRAYRDGAPGAKKYKEWLTQNAERFGLTSKAAQDIENPVLVRVRTGQMSPQHIDVGFWDDEEGRKQYSPKGNDYMIVGKKGATALDTQNMTVGQREKAVRMDNQKIAEQMEAEGKDVKTIWMATGWQKGKDGKWRYEIADGKWKPAAFKNPDVVLDKTTTDGTRYRETTLEQIYDAPNLYRAYPELKKTEVTIAPMRGAQGEYSPMNGITLSDELFKTKDENLMRQIARLESSAPYIAYQKALAEAEKIEDPNEWDRVTRRLEEEWGSTSIGSALNKLYSKPRYVTTKGPSEGVMRTLVHEIQHAVQNIEGTMRGGGPEYMDWMLKNRQRALKAADIFQRFKAARDKNPSATDAEITAEVKRVFNAEARMFRMTPEMRVEWDNLFESYKDGALKAIKNDVQFKKDLNDLRKKTDWKSGLKPIASGRDAYERLESEVEARGASKRLEMTEKERAATPLSETENIPREDQIVLNDEREATGVNSLFEADDFDAQDKGEFGPVYRGYEGESAVAKLMKEKQGEVISAMRDPRLGDNSSIDFVWGIPGDPQKNYKGGYGFAHIKAKHGIEAAELVPKIIREGKIELQDDKDLAIYQSADGVVALRRTWDDKAKNWVLTSYLPNTMKDPRPDRTSEIVGQTGESGSSPDRDLSKKTIPHPAEIDNADKTLDSTADPYGKNDGEIEIADPENKSLVRVKDIFTAMRKIAPVRKGIATRKKGVVGVAKKDSHVARTRYWNDIPTALHETGHILDYKMGLREDIPMPMERNAINEELLDLGKRTSGEKVVADYENGDVSSATFQDAEAYLTKEGIAEFFREYALDPTRAEQLAPSYYKRFTETLENHERFASVVKELEKVTRDYYSQSLHDRALAGIHSGGEKEKLSLKETAQKAWDKFLFEIDDRTIYLKKIQDMVKDYAMKFAPEMMQGKYLKDKFAFHTLLRTMPGFMGKAKSDIKAMLEPLKKMGAERYEDLQVYLKLRGALDYWDNDMEPGIGMNRSEAESEINRIAAAYPIIPEAAEKVRTAYNSMVEKTMVDSGIWSMDELTQWREKFKNYVPFMRVNDDGSVRLPPTKGKSGSTFIDLGKGTAQRKGLGGENAFMGTQDPVEAMLKNVLIFNRLAEKNRIGQALVASAEAAPTEFSWLAEPITTNEKSGGSTFHVWRDGKKQLFATDPDILEALTGMDQAFSNNILLQTAAKFSNTLKLGATRMNPAFWMVNLARDAAYASLVSDSMAPPLWNTAKGLVALASKDAETQELVKKAFDSGVGYSGITELGLNMSNKKVSQAIRRQIGDEKFWKKFTGAWDASVGEMNERIEMAPKITEFINLVKKGVPERQAAMMAREVNLDFSRGGRTGKAVNQVTAFSNPAVQGTSKLARTAFSKETAGKFWLKTGLFVVLPSIISWALNKDDDEYKRLSRDLKDRYWMFKAGDKWIRIPKPELAGLCGSFTERLLDDLNKKDPDAFRGFGRAVFEAAAPSLLPTILTPILEHKMEKSFFFDNDIIPKKLQGLPPEMQYTRDTSSIARFLGKAWGVSPMIVDNYIKGYTGGAGEALSKLPDTIMDITGTSGNVPREAKRFSEYLLINRFTADPLRNSESIKRFYDLKEQTATERAGFEAKIRAGERLKMPYDAAMAKSFAKTGESLSELRKTIASIQRSKNIGPEEKRKRIDRLNLQMNQLAERMLDRYYKGRDRR